MNAKQIIAAAGGRKAVIEMTGLTRGRISQWVVSDQIPKAWLKFFEAKFPHVDFTSSARVSGHAGRQPPSPANILDTVPGHCVVLPAIPPSIEVKEKP